MKRYKFEIIVEEGSDEFWEELNEEHGTGCDHLLSIIKEDLEHWQGIEIKLTSFENK